MNADGSDLERVVHAGYSDSEPGFSPSGRRIAYTTDNAIRSVRTDGTKRRRLLKADADRPGVSGPQYSPNGRRIAFAGWPQGKHKGGIWTVRRDGSHLRRLTTGDHARDPDYTPDGRQIMFVRQSAIRLMRADGSRERLISNSSYFVTPAFAPAGDRIVVAICDLPGRYCACTVLDTMSRTGSDPKRVVDYCDFARPPIGTAFSPSWQPLPGSG